MEGSIPSLRANFKNTKKMAKKKIEQPEAKKKTALSEKELQDIANVHLANYPNSGCVFGADNGKFFLEKQEKEAEKYAEEKGILLHKFSREQEVKDGE